MRKRAGGTVKLSISLPKETVAALRSRAERDHGGNVSAVIAELAEEARIFEGMDALIEHLGGPILTPEDSARLDALWAEVPSRPRKKRKRVA
jgi:hypothetical protein